MTKPCTLCGSAERRTLFALGEWDVQLCACGLRSLFPEPTTVQMEEFDDGSGYAHYQSFKDAIIAQHGRTLAGLEGVVPAGTLLDVGCGTGWFMQAASERGWQSTGVDPSPYSVEQTRALGLEAHEGLLEDQRFEEGSFDAISLLQVVEHLPDPRALLAACRRLLRPGGALLVATPNPDGWLAKATKKDWNYWIPPMHCVWYPPQALRRLLEQNGFRAAAGSTWSARIQGLHDASEVLNATPLRVLRGRGRGIVVELLSKTMDASGKGTIVEQIAVRP